MTDKTAVMSPSDDSMEKLTIVESRPPVRRYLPVLLVALAGFGITTVAWLAIQGAEERAFLLEFEQSSAQFTRLLREESNVTLLSSVGGHLSAIHSQCPKLVVDRGLVDATRFSSFTGQDSQVGYLCTLEVSQQGSGSVGSLAAEVATRRAPRSERSAARKKSYPVYYAWPGEVSEELLGADLGDDDLVRAAITHAMATERVAIAGRRPLVVDGPAVLEYWHVRPFFRDATSENGTPVLAGVAVVLFRFRADWSSLGRGGFNFLLTDEGARDLDAGSGRSEADSPIPNASFVVVDGLGEEPVRRSTPFELLGRRWRLITLPRADLQAFYTTGYANTVLFGGLLATLLGSFLMWRSLEREELIRRQVAIRTEALVRSRAKEQQARIEAKQMSSQKMEAIGTLAGGVAHDFNNLLVGILCSVETLKLNPKVRELGADAIDIIERAAHRASRLTQQLTGFSQRGKQQQQSVNLGDSVGEVVTLLSRTIDKRILVRSVIDSDEELFVRGDPTQLQQVILNLGINARDAMPNGGTLTFGVRLAGVAASNGAGEYVVLTVEDEGCGMTPDVRQRAFDPFFTTKGPGEGSGMGLAMVYGIVKSHGGRVELESSPGEGTKASVYLPRDTEEVTRSGAVVMATDGSVPVSGKGRILLVDDEETVRAAATSILTALGYEVVTAKDGEEAVDYYVQHAHSIDLVILDMIMPRMGGSECFRALRKVNPRLKAILSTGYERDRSAQQLLEEGALGLCQKPYRMREFSETIKRTLSTGVH